MYDFSIFFFQIFSTLRRRLLFLLLLLLFRLRGHSFLCHTNYTLLRDNLDTPLVTGTSRYEQNIVVVAAATTAAPLGLKNRNHNI